MMVASGRLEATEHQYFSPKVKCIAAHGHNFQHLQSDCLFAGFVAGFMLWSSASPGAHCEVADLASVPAAQLFGLSANAPHACYHGATTAVGGCS